jgi:hypothetical protein
VLTVLGALFVAVGDAPDTIYTDTAVAPVDSFLFATSLSHLVNAPLEQADQIQLVEWQGRNLFVRFLQRFARVLEKQS